MWDREYRAKGDEEEMRAHLEGHDDGLVAIEAPEVRLILEGGLVVVAQKVGHREPLAAPHTTETCTIRHLHNTHKITRHME